MDGFDKDKCEQRNRVCAQREEVEGAAIRFLAQSASDVLIEEAAGTLLQTDDEVMAAINALLPEGAEPLSKDQVYVHYIEAASDNFIGDRYAFLAESTLRNIAADAAQGVAFMNSHRTGSISTPSELPFGKTFAGQYRVGVDADGRRRKCAMVGFYMLRGVQPTGAQGPSTDDLHKMIAGGQVQDVSVGLSKGEAHCDVCADPLADCSHVPGTRRAMSDEQIEAQTARGIPGGRASYTIEKARLGEVSAVFDGAVPGAGVKKVMLNRRKLNRREFADARQAFGALLNRGAAMDENLFDQVTEAVKEGVKEAFAAAPPTDTDKGETEMAEANTAVAEMQARLAEQEARFAALQAEKEQAEKLAAESTSRIAKLEADAQRTRFTNRVKAGQWFGAEAEHVEHLCKLAGAFGEASDEVKFYCTNQDAHAQQLKESGLFKEVGKDTAGEKASATDELNALASKRSAESGGKLSFAQAYSEVCEANQQLYERHVAEWRAN